MKPSGYRLVFLLFCVALAPIASNAIEKVDASSAELDEPDERVEIFRAPRLLETPKPRFPKSMQKRGREGWVQLSMMIDPEGHTYDINVYGSSGDPEFERAALLAAQDWKYQPAELEGQPIDAGTQVAITFALSGKDGARGSFVREYRQLNKALQQQDRRKVEMTLNRLQRMRSNIYEEAFLQFGKYQHALLWGDTEAQLRAIGRAGYLDRGKGFLPAALLNQVLATKMLLEFNLVHLGRARHTGLQLLQQNIDAPLRGQVESLMQKIDELVSGTGTLVRSGAFGSQTSWNHTLLRPRFSFTNISGDISEVRLHCDKGRVGFRAEADMLYSVDARWKKCFLRAIGDPGTTFELREYASG